MGFNLPVVKLINRENRGPGKAWVKCLYPSDGFDESKGKFLSPLEGNNFHIGGQRFRLRPGMIYLISSPQPDGTARRGHYRVDENMQLAQVQQSDFAELLGGRVAVDDPFARYAEMWNLEEAE